MEKFEKRVFGCAIVKAINSNYNADFSGQPRTLPNGIVYATDKAFKYTIKNYLKDVNPETKIFYFKRINPLKSDDFIPFSLIEAFCHTFPELAEVKEKVSKKKKNEGNEDSEEVSSDKITVKLKASKSQVCKALISCLDIRLFGATFAMKGDEKKDNVAISLHGPVQINHGMNIWHENSIYSEQIMSPFRNPSKENEEDKNATTLGRQSKLQEGHYVHHFSVNPQNLKDVLAIAGVEIGLSTDDIEKLKEAMRRGATWYDSAAKAGTENELLIWVQLKAQSKLVLPNFTSFITIDKAKQEGKSVYDLSVLATELKKHLTEVEAIEIYVNAQKTVLKNLPEKAEIKEL